MIHIAKIIHPATIFINSIGPNFEHWTAQTIISRIKRPAPLPPVVP